MDTHTNSLNPDITSGKHISFWTDSTPSAHPKPLRDNLYTDVVIVGGGIAGITTAYCLSKSGKKVIVVEDGQIGSGETGRTTAHMVTALDDRYYNLRKTFGVDRSKLIAESHQSAIDLVERIVKEENIECGFKRVDGYLFLHPTDDENSLEKEFDAAKEAGIEIERADRIPGLLKQTSGLRFKNQAQFHPLQFLEGLCKAIEKNGGKIFTNTHAAEITHEGIISEDGFKIKAMHVVVATNSPVNNLFVTIEKQVAYRTYVIGALIKKGAVQDALWWDTGDFKVNAQVPPYHYIRVHPYNEEYDLIISGGEDHPTGDTDTTEVPEEERYRLVESWTREHFPIGEIIYRWSGQVMEPMDGIAYIGRNSFDHDNVYIITGDSGNGMTHCTFAGMLITDLINGRENKWEKLYSPSRINLKAGAQAIKQFFTETMLYLTQMPNFNGTDELAELKNGEGRIIDMLEEKFGVYRDLEGRLFIVSAKCTHLKCSVAWNADELSWDCPCHGSRFTYEGKVINGPANTDLPAFSFVEDHLEKK